MKFFVTAIGTDSGKTVFSAILTEALEADYWKPVQAGYPTDTEQVKSLVKNPNSQFFPETYLLKTPASPHASARIDGLEIKMDQFQVPPYGEHLVIEGAGGTMVPLNDRDLMIDLIKQLDARVVLVSDLYLGSINHTLLTVELFRSRGIEPFGLVFNGESNPESERIISEYSGYPVLLRIAREETIDWQTIKKYSNEFRSRWESLAED